MAGLLGSQLLLFEPTAQGLAAAMVLAYAARLVSALPVFLRRPGSRRQTSMRGLARPLG